MHRISPRTELQKILSVVATIPACFLLFSGGFVLLRYGGSHGFRNLAMYGLLPVLGGICWLLMAAWLWSRATGESRFAEALKTIGLRAFGAIALASLAVLVWSKWKGR
jgi:hypothetical protein